MTTYASAIRHALDLASRSLDVGDVDAVRTWTTWARTYADDAYGSAPIRDAAGLVAALDREVIA